MMTASLQFALRESLDELLCHLNFCDLLLFNFGHLWTFMWVQLCVNHILLIAEWDGRVCLEENLDSALSR